MSKLTKAERDTLVKKISENKLVRTLGVIATVLAGGVASFIGMCIGISGPATKPFWVCVVVGVVCFGLTMQADAKVDELQDKLDKDSE